MNPTEDETSFSETTIGSGSLELVIQEPYFCKIRIHDSKSRHTLKVLLEDYPLYFGLSSDDLIFESQTVRLRPEISYILFENPERDYDDPFDVTIRYYPSSQDPEECFRGHSQRVHLGPPYNSLVWIRLLSGMNLAVCILEAGWFRGCRESDLQHDGFEWSAPRMRAITLPPWNQHNYIFVNPRAPLHAIKEHLRISDEILLVDDRDQPVIDLEIDSEKKIFLRGFRVCFSDYRWYSCCPHGKYRSRGKLISLYAAARGPGIEQMHIMKDWNLQLPLGSSFHPELTWAKYSRDRILMLEEHLEMEEELLRRLRGRYLSFGYHLESRIYQASDSESICFYHLPGSSEYFSGLEEARCVFPGAEFQKVSFAEILEIFRERNARNEAELQEYREAWQAREGEIRKERRLEGLFAAVLGGIDPPPMGAVELGLVPPSSRNHGCPLPNIFY